MNKRTNRLIGGGVLLTAAFAALSAQGGPELVEFKSGDPVSAAAFNTNFSNIAASIATLEQQVADLRDELEEAHAAAGYMTITNGAQVPYFRKLFTATKTSTTVTIPHGIGANPATERRFIGCEVTANYEDNGTPRQTVALNNPSGTSTAYWCDLDDANLTVQWINGDERQFQVTLDYVLQPIQQ